ncbi:hypothetical protein J7E97_01425 [Streptomyces sp. ISL-66]|uniref:hypothetical protein n=1 Tax=Streptomyces sp. ISL-66 TaxID=2819186 RepID=UPI001BE8E1DF|nr:hypothetical protein [Streptomyces sp. ISL-66]MBT2466556.1 hypothetical protein [Streptomyces sp. ISL-66]
MAAIPLDLLDRIRELERKVRELAGRAQMRPALDQILHGDITIGEGGQLIAQTPQGAVTFKVGQTAQGDWGVFIRRADGSRALTVGDDILEDDQMLRLWSRDLGAPDKILVMDDAFSDRFLGRPLLPIQLHPTERQNTSSTNWEPAWWGTTPATHAVAHLSLTTYANTGGGQVRVTMEADGMSPITVAEYDCPAGVWTDREIKQPMHGIEYMQWVDWTIEHRNQQAGRDIETRLYYAINRHTFSPDEAPSLPTRTPPAAAAATPPPPPAARKAPPEQGLRTIDD